MEQVFEALTAHRNHRYPKIESTIVSAHRQAATEERVKDRALRRSLRFIVSSSQVGDITQDPALLEGRASDTMLTDKSMMAMPYVKQPMASA